MEEKKLTDEEIVMALRKQPPYDTVLYLEKGINATDIIALIHRLQDENESLKKDYIELDLECRELRTELDKELAEHEEFTKKAKAVIERLKIDLEIEKKWTKIQRKQAVEDTAREILQMVDNHLRGQDQWIINKTQGGSVYKLAIAEIKLLIKERYGVEVE